MKENEINTTNTSESGAKESVKVDEVKTEHTLYAEPIFHVGGFTITNSLINSWMAVFILVVVSFALRKQLKAVPGYFQNFIELVFEYIQDLVHSVTNNKETTSRFLPLIFCFFVYIIVNNWLGLLPGVGSIGQIVEMHGEKLFIPFLRGGTADINTTLALALIGVIATHVFGIRSNGAWSYFNRFINFKALIAIPMKIKNGLGVLIEKPIEIFIGLIESVGELTKLVSLSLRLFGNVYAGEVLLASVAGLVAFIVPIPFMFLEVFVGYVQSLVFASLILSFLVMAVESHDHEEAH